MTAGIKVEGRNRTLILVNILIATIAASLLMTALNTALSPVCKDFGISVSTGQWLISGEVLSMGIVMPLSAFLMRRFRTRRLYLTAIIIFMIGLLLAMFSQNFPVMMVGRVLQGAGNGMLMTMAQVIILSIFPPEKSGSAMGLYGLATAVSPMIAPTLGGILADTAGWRSIFFVDLIVMAIALIMACCFFKNVLDTEKTKLDMGSFLLSILAFGGIALGVGNLSNYGFDSPMVWISLIVGAVGMVIFVRRQIRLPKPFLDVNILKIRKYMVSVIASMLIYFALMGTGVVMPLFIQNVLGRSATISGLVTLPGSILMAIISPIAGRFYDRHGIKSIFVFGAAALLLSNILLCTLNIDSPLMLTVLYNMIRFSAAGAIQMTVITWGTIQVEPSRVTDAAALLQSFRTFAGSIGAAVLVGIMSTVTTKSAVTYGDLAGMRGVTAAFLGATIVSAVVLFIAIFSVKGKLAGNNP